MNYSAKSETASLHGPIATAVPNPQNATLAPPDDHTINHLISSFQSEVHGETGPPEVRGGIKCGVASCTHSFTGREEAREHLRLVHYSANGRLLCPAQGCAKTFTSVSSLNCHYRSHASPEYFVCPYNGCNKSYATSGRLRTHIRRTHVEIGEFQCKENGCTKVFTHSLLLKRHRERVHGIGAIVLECPHEGCHYKTTHGQGSMQRHIQNVHTVYDENNPMPYQCSWCGAHFKTGSNLNGHLKALHSEEQYRPPKLECSFHGCTKVFRCRAELRDHEVLHSNATLYQCDICGKLCASRNLLLSHKKYHHLEPGFCCEICGAKFRTSQNFKKHQDKLHSRNVSVGKILRCVQEGCCRWFRKPENLLKHLVNTHHRLDCPECAEAFDTPDAFWQHYGTHQKEVPAYDCHVCGRQFPTFSETVSHLASEHPQETRVMSQNECSQEYACSVCGMVLSGEIALKIHERRHIPVGFEQFLPPAGEIWGQLDCPFCAKVYHRTYIMSFIRHIRDQHHAQLNRLSVPSVATHDPGSRALPWVPRSRRKWPQIAHPPGKGIDGCLERGTVPEAQIL